MSRSLTASSTNNSAVTKRASINFQTTSPSTSPMSQKFSVAQARLPDAVGQEVLLQGWIRTRRDSKGGFSFLELNDGSSLRQHPGRRPRHAAELRVGHQAAHGRLQRQRRGPGQGLAGQGPGHRGRGPQRDRPRLGRSRFVPHPEEGGQFRVPPHGRPPAAADQHLRRHGPRAKLRLPLDPRLLPGRRLPLRPHADHHGQRLRRGRGDVQGHHARPRPIRRCRKKASTSPIGTSISRRTSSSGRRT